MACCTDDKRLESSACHCVSHTGKLRTFEKLRADQVCCQQVANMVSRDLEKQCIVVFDEAHNIDNVCIEVQSPVLPPSTLLAVPAAVAQPANVLQSCGPRIDQHNHDSFPGTCRR